MPLLEGYEGRKVMIEVSGHKVECVVTIEWETGLFPVIGEDFDLGSQKDNEAYLRRFYKGELENVDLTVIARAEGLEGLDSLGSCHVVTKDFVKSLMETIKDNDMVNIAIEDLKISILQASVRLAKYKPKEAV